MPPKRDRLLKALLIMTSFSMIVVWLPLIRGLMDGATYEWGQTFLGLSFGGKGLGGYYWLVVLQAVVAIALVYLGWRGGTQPFHWLLLFWNISGAINAFFNSIRFPEQYRFQGDTLGVDISVAWVAPLFWGALALLSAWWVIRDLRGGGVKELIHWNSRNSFLLLVAVGLLPVQYLLLRFGQPHDTTDQIGVIVTMLQWLIINLALVQWRSSETLPIEQADGIEKQTYQAVSESRL